jgi:DNA-binding PadR family transcriptional regulator
VSTRFLVLALLAQQPRYGYEVRRWIAESHAERWTDIKPYSIHHALAQLEREGLAAVDRVEPTARRDRTVYAITENGRHELHRLARNLWTRTPRTYPVNLFMLITFLGVLPPAEVRRLAEGLAATISAELAAWGEGRVAKEPLPSLWEAMFDNGCAHLEADLALVRRVIDELPATTSESR